VQIIYLFYANDTSSVRPPTNSETARIQLLQIAKVCDVDDDDEIEVLRCFIDKECGRRLMLKSKSKIICAETFERLATQRHAFIASVTLSLTR